MDQNRVGDRGGNICFSKAGLAQSIVTAGTLNIVNNVRFAVDGITYELAAVNNAPFSSGHTTLAAGCECLFALWLDNGNNITSTQGSIVDTASLSSTGGTKVVPLPNIVSDKALFGLVKVKTAGAATFVPGTTNLNATNVTATFYDCSVMPSKPFLS